VRSGGDLHCLPIDRPFEGEKAQLGMRKPGSGKSVLSENEIFKSIYRVMAPEVTCSVTFTWTTQVNSSS
jgi:hypothetical protein